jgi:DNA gyrase/topoisomerase IV subunit A
MISTSDGMVTKTLVRDIPVQGRNTYGVKLMNVKEGERVVALDVV